MDADHANNKTCTVFNVNVGMEEINHSEIAFYPNPVVDELVIESKGALTEYQLVVRDVVGRTIASRASVSGNRFVLNTTDWPAGIYFVSVENATQQIVRKLVKR